MKLCHGTEEYHRTCSSACPKTANRQPPTANKPAPLVGFPFPASQLSQSRYANCTKPRPRTAMQRSSQRPAPPPSPVPTGYQPPGTPSPPSTFSVLVRDFLATADQRWVGGVDQWAWQVRRQACHRLKASKSQVSHLTCGHPLPIQPPMTN
ncbi:hypothetical protein P152DRAFT_106932 [Eremomyces bilateralis CBS 781.70]|uniref:Uncharacterized protein n=1 Tax=Eremomyces bilateralis CBS 781.70 TaxID=1392243 RepID=A0A6G1FXC9_9PEZI|nr:uncharacterized protein P152DRAFT_106932 [Eremomyces bilateralis CBS 781.70]KAF1810279.1 hypothetical protein P152DRAFT_106932 [Eremomyces bilateralis CBS 781.70]